MGDSSPAKDVSSDSKSMNLLLDLENVSVLKNHVLFENNEKEKPFFEKRSNLNRLIKTIYENKAPFQCKACSERFPENSSLRTHITSVHEGKKLCKSSKLGDKLFQCITCDVRFTQKGSLNRHMVKIHTKLRSCKLCDSVFDDGHNLKIHICLGRIDGLNQHVETVHESKKPAKSGIKCGGCDGSFLDRKALIEHFKIEHPTLISTINPKRL